MSRPDFEESRQFPAESCTELGADPDHAGCGPNGEGLGPMAWLLVAVLALVLVFCTVHLAVGVA